MNDRQLIEDLLSALEYHTEQTRPIQFSRVAIEAAREHLAQQAPVQYQRREIGEGDWEDCTKEQYECAEGMPEMDTRLTATPQAQPAPVQEPVGGEWTPCMKLPVVVHVRKQRLGEAHVSTREGITPVKPDDLIMRGVSGEEYPIGRAIFEQTYTLDTTPQAQPKENT